MRTCQRISGSALVVFLLFSISATASGTKGLVRHPHLPQIIAYIFPRDRALQASDVAAEKLTRINYAFANIQDGRIVTGSPVDAANFATLVGLKRQNPSLQVLVSVGGWTWSGNFSDMALTKASRRRFIDSVVEFVDRYHLDGLDIDWEYPGLTGAGNRFRPEDKRNYTLLLEELRARFNQEQIRLARPLLLSVAAGSSSDFIAHTDLGRVERYVDTVNLMAYDYYEPDSDKISGNHAPLYTDPADPKRASADQSVQDFERAGVPPRKIVLGVPFYGHVWGDVPPTNHGLFQPGGPVPKAFTNYGNIVTNMLNQGFTRYWDTAASVPYLYSEQKREFVSYEDTESLALKCAYIRRKGLGGVMFWEYTGDPTGALLNTINTAFYGKGADAGSGQ
ncbi:MAG TPA: glycoside hydrolase family 18 protein [Acidobacteriaceae bacterium]|nr:glycoside hydrolase family 18 protein [Acidobacteriaceae bacterium]